MSYKVEIIAESSLEPGTQWINGTFLFEDSK